MKCAITLRPKPFPDERMKLLYALSLMSGGSAQIWAQNETEEIIMGTSSISTFSEFAKRVEATFRDPHYASTAQTKLHNLRMTDTWHVCR